MNSIFILTTFLFIQTTPVQPLNGTKKHIVTLTNSLKFIPETLTVYTEDTIIWKNESDLAHTVTADFSKQRIEGSVIIPSKAKSFDSGILKPGEKFIYIFTVPGFYKYFCIPHEAAKMIGYIRVLERKK